MKRRVILFALSCIIAFALGACGDSRSQEQTAVPSVPADEGMPKPMVEGEKFENDKFSITIANGWESMDIEGGVQIYKMSGEAVQVYFRGYNMSESEAESQSKGHAEQYGGTTPQEVEKWGKKFWTTTYTAMDLEQLSYLRIEDGVLISVSAAAKEIESNTDIIGMLESITFK